MNETTGTEETNVPAQTDHDEDVRREKYEVEGDNLLSKVKQIIHEGNVRRVIIRNEDGQTLVEIPLTIGVVGTALAPVWAAIGAIAALVANCTIVVERLEE